MRRSSRMPHTSQIRFRLHGSAGDVAPAKPSACNARCGALEQAGRVERGFSVSESKKNLDPNDPAYYAPPRSRDRNNDPVSSGRDRQALSISRGLEEHLANLRAAKSGNRLPTAQSDVFADALSRMLREQIENGRGDMPSVLKKRSSVRIAAKLAVAVVSAAVVALAYVLFSAPQGAPDDRLWSALRSWQSPKSDATAALSPQRQ